MKNNEHNYSPCGMCHGRSAALAGVLDCLENYVDIHVSQQAILILASDWLTAQSQANQEPRKTLLTNMDFNIGFS